MSNSEEHFDDSAIAIIGMACKLPGAATPESFWSNIRDGVESISFLKDEELEASDLEPGVMSDSRYVKAAPVLDDVELFDAGFFNITPNEALVMDPQHRLFLETGWASLEDAGYNPERYGGAVGVFAGARTSSYLFNIFANREMGLSMGAFEIGLGNDAAFLTSRVSYKLNLTGPSYSVHTACSTSLVAIHLACNSLLINECQMALAGGVAVNVPHKSGYLYRKGGILSPDGHCRAFDSRAQGTIFGSGVGVVVLKRLEDAIRDKDHLYALIKGTATNNDGWSKASFTAPAIRGQNGVVLDALANAGVEADSIQYVEAHGTGTPLGDPIEVQALTKAYRTQSKRRGYCALGSVKTNVGHLDAAAGVAGLIKTVLALKHREIPPTLHFVEANPELGLEETPFYVNSEVKEWKANGHPRRAGVSAFGVGGTNAHVVLEEAPRVERAVGGSKRQLLVISARSGPALERATENLAGHLKRHPELELRDVAYTLQAGRKSFAHRRFVTCQSVAEAVEALEKKDQNRLFSGEQEQQERPVVFLFPGQGSQYAGMGQGLYAEPGAYRGEFDRCAEILRDEMQVDLREVLYGQAGDRKELEETWLVQPAMFAVEYAIARTWMSWGVEPEAMLGHSLGEYVAACLAGVFSLEEGLRLVARRGRLMQSCEPGAMLAVGVGTSEAAAMAAAGLSLAAVNGPQQCVLSGTRHAVEELERRLAQDGISSRRLKTSHAFHSATMDPMLARFRLEVQKIRLQDPQRKYLSNVTGTWISKQAATDPEYWVEQLRHTVRFAEGMSELLKDPRRIFLETGPGQALIRLANRNSEGGHRPAAIGSMPSSADVENEAPYLLNAVGKLWLSGGPFNWENFHAEDACRRIPLPTYPFEGQRYWIDPHGPGETRPKSGAAGKKPSVEDWFYLPSWRRSVAAKEQPSAEPQQWILFADRSELASTLRQRMEAEGRSILTVYRGREFRQYSEHEFAVDPARSEDYRALMQAVPSASVYKILHLWSLTPEPVAETGKELFTSLQSRGYYSLLLLSQAINRAALNADVLLVSDCLHQIEDADTPYPEKQPMLAVCQVVPQESPNIVFRSMELDPSWASCPAGDWASRILDEAKSASEEMLVAYRGPRRLVRAFDPVKLGKNCKMVRQLRAGGAYLITGGFGGVGALIGDHLARTFGAKLVLTSRTAMPARELWPEILKNDSHGDVSLRIQQIQKLEALGAEVMAVPLDITDSAQVGLAFETAERRFGPIHGIFHAAGVTTGDSLFKSFNELGTAESEIQFGPKVYGVYALQQALQDRTPDFCLLFSSSAAILGGLGYLTYAAANLFLDAFSQTCSRGGTAWISANWDPWPKEIKKLQQAKTSIDQYAMTAEESVEALTRTLKYIPSGQVVIATGDLGKRLSIWIKRLSDGNPGEATFVRPQLAIEYEAPSSDLEERIAGIWQRVLGIDRIGRNDNFFDLGGHSLLATRLIGQLRDEFQCEVSINKFFETPTIAEVASLIEIAKSGGEESERSAILAMLAQLSDEEVDLELKKQMAAI